MIEWLFGFTWCWLQPAFSRKVNNYANRSRHDNSINKPLALIRAGNSSSNGHRSIRLGSDSHRQDFADIILQRPDYDDSPEEFSSCLCLFGNCPAGKLVPEQPIPDNEFFFSFE